MNDATPRIVVCGTAFGRVYLRAVHDDPEVELAGVVSRGSAASAGYAKYYGVPHFTSVDELPDDIDIACVAVRAGAAGGDGAELAQRLLSRGIHVLQEHLLHPDELTACLRTAREHGVRYRLNAFYPHLPPVRLFLAAAAILRERGRPLHVDAAAGSQVVYSLLDIIGRAVGGLRPWTIADPAPLPADIAALAGTRPPYTPVRAVIGGVPVSLRVQNQIHPGDPDNHALLLHRLAIAFEGGVLSLADTHGPVLWSPRLHTGRDATGRLIMGGPGTERLDVPSTEILGPAETPTFRAVFDEVWPGSVRFALGELRADIADPGRSTAAAQWAVTVTALWQRLTTALGPPELIRPPDPVPVPLPELLAENRSHAGDSA
ncbi:Gfo/Idh/MocA family oxidoreductase [Nocardia cyriacigeorgica]|uniref:Gfo/Idh/MocA family oxidoreductase n=1 Tax=Nocardia cyriacigeorgica TaxID=135487 RepID=UPI0018941A9E|nr:Gfo/Idh/MocA family oxidoreductase [Nocardia cyriacigeorgica]MBF6454658.1 Gfo/Idh/MocA family oxidoreductase [Nocardia cyriacigeorgica]MBF6477077.1 Gfo/Idh/MocA family oxidoreductase [Nocardia cyriacigeorgica]MBF6552552.1 Gfo/Idh/MocA family oxidoreductase [Nocardia cyriacigeorgica]